MTAQTEKSAADISDRETREQIGILIAARMTHVEIAYCIGMTVADLQSKYPEELRIGGEVRVGELVAAMYLAADKGDAEAIDFIQERNAEAPLQWPLPKAIKRQ